MNDYFRLTQLIDETKIAYKDLDVITSPEEFREQEKVIADLELQIKNIVDNWGKNYATPT